MLLFPQPLSPVFSQVSERNRYTCIEQYSEYWIQFYSYSSNSSYWTFHRAGLDHILCNIINWDPTVIYLELKCSPRFRLGFSLFLMLLDFVLYYLPLWVFLSCLYCVIRLIWIGCVITTAVITTMQSPFGISKDFKKIVVTWYF